MYDLFIMQRNRKRVEHIERLMNENGIEIIQQWFFRSHTLGALLLILGLVFIMALICLVFKIYMRIQKLFCDYF